VRVALVHDWLTGMRGGEKVLDVLCELFPDADLYTLLHVPGSVSPRIEQRRIHTSFIQHLPRVATGYRRYLPLFPAAIERFRFSGYDLVISSSHAVAKSVRTAPVRHLCYCHSPMRYAWDQFDAYFGPDRVGPLASRWVYRPILERLSRWDAATADRVDRFVANSRYVAGRIGRYYNRTATVIYPPVDTVFYQPGSAVSSDHVLIVSALVPYKRIDLAITACQRAGVGLRIAGHGPERGPLEQHARTLGADVTFLGNVDDRRLRSEYQAARALLMPGEEDFGIVPVEAQACGTPVIALGRGGALETVVAGTTGLFFQEPTADALATAIADAGSLTFDRAAIRAHAEQFSRATHLDAMRAVVEDTLAAPGGSRW
jgi:glycosyltransferase involved in cell wall biosynthesis